MQSELYLGAQSGTADAAKIAAQQPDLVVFNGYANQYAYRPLPATVGERVRVWTLDAGPNTASSFHVVGGQFDTVFFEGAYTLRPSDIGGSQALAMHPAQGGFVELVFPKVAGALKLAVTWQMSFLYAIVFGGFVAFSTYLPKYLLTIYPDDVDAVGAGTRTALFAAAAVVARPIGGVLADRFGPKVISLVSLAGIVASAYVVGQQPRRACSPARCSC